MTEKICKYCAMKIPAAAKVCPHCRKGQGFSTAKGCLIIIIAGFALILIISIMNTNTNQGTADRGTTSSATVSVGEEGYLDSGGEATPVATSEAAFDAWTKARVAKDDIGQRNLLMAGMILAPLKGARVRVIDMGSMFVRKIRILDGEFKERSGFVAEEYIKK